MKWFPQSSNIRTIRLEIETYPPEYYTADISGEALLLAASHFTKLQHIYIHVQQDSSSSRRFVHPMVENDKIMKSLLCLSHLPLKSATVLVSDDAFEARVEEDREDEWLETRWSDAEKREWEQIRGQKLLHQER